MEFIQEGALDRLHELNGAERRDCLSPLESAAIASSANVLIQGQKVLITEAKPQEGTVSMGLDEAFDKDPMSVLRPVGITQGGTEALISAVKTTRSNSKADGTLALYGVKAALAQLQGVRMGVITTALDEANIPDMMRAFFQKDGKQVSPVSVGIEPEEVEPQFTKMLSFKEVSADGTVIFTLKKPTIEK